MRATPVNLGREPRSSQATAIVRYSGLAAMLGGAVWIVSWTGIELMESGVVSLFGLKERGWRLLLDPVYASWLAALIGWHIRHGRRGGRLALAGFLVSLLALLTMLAGNLIEFRIGELFYENVPGQWEPTDHLGWSIGGAGFMLLPVGMILLGVGALSAKAMSPWKRAVPLVFGSVMILRFVQGFVVLLLTNDPMQEGWMIMPMLLFGIGWIVLGAAIWTDRHTV